MAEARTCQECGELVPESAPGNYCPNCLLALVAPVGLKHTAPDSPESESVLPANWVFGNYELLEKIGEGGMGVVYRARQTSLSRIVALKMMRSGALATEKETKRFRVEAQAAGRLQHPNVVRIHEVGEYNGQAFFSMDYIEGKSLAEVVRRTPLPAERAARYVRIIAEAMHHAHEHGVLHRDLKPANVLLDALDQPRITDFGLAKRVEAESFLTQPGVILGTPSYMPPEQAAGKLEAMTPRSDVYSMGAILYDLLTGRPPFRADTPLDTLRQVLDTEPAPPRLLNPKVPHDLETVCLKCLSKEPADRYSSARELAEDLGRYLQREPIRARPVGRLERLWRWGRRAPALAGSAAVTSLLFLLLAVAAAWQVSDAAHGNSVTARLASQVIRHKLDLMGAEVKTLAQDPAFFDEVSQGDRTSQKSFLARHYTNNALVQGLRLANWMLINTNGSVLARWPDGSATSEVNLTNRDYFQGALRLMPSPYVSQVYRSVLETNDLMKDRFGVAVAVQDSNTVVRAVVSAMVQLNQVQEAFGFDPGQRKLMMIGKYEGTNYSKPKTDPAREQHFMVMMHPGLDRKDQVVFIDHRYLREMVQAANVNSAVRKDHFFRDPLRRFHWTYEGFWLASFVRVPETTFVVICQTRNHVANAILTAGTMGVVVALGLLGWYRQRHMRWRPIPADADT